MEGFFTKKETESVTRPDGKTYSCISCGLLKNCKNPKLKAVGNFSKGIINIFDKPTSLEDARNKGFTSKFAKLLEKEYAKIGIDLYEDCLNVYSLRCTSFTKATPYQIDSCRKYTLQTIKENSPKVIVLFGDTPLQSVIGYKWKKSLGKIAKWRGFTIPDQDFKSWVLPTLSPNTILDEDNAIEQLIWKQDLKRVVEVLKIPFPLYKAPKIVDISNDLSPLNDIVFEPSAFDYETTGLKPHADGHKIVCASVAVSANKVYTFMMPTSRKKRKPFRDYIKRESAPKIAHNMKYEDNWTNEILKVPVANWLWDTMLATHVIDNREGICSLKFQTYIQFGIVDYDSEINPYLKAKDEKNANAINQIGDLLNKSNGQELLLKYCGMDSIFEYRLAQKQRAYMLDGKGLEKPPKQSNFSKAYELLHNGILELAKAERQGLRIDTTYTEKKARALTRKIKRLEDTFFETKFYRHWAHTTKGKPNLNSPPQLASFLYGVKKIEPLVFTDKGKGAVSEVALELLKIPELDLLLQRSKLKKLRDTYLGAFMREQINGVMHPGYNLHTVTTYRSSSSNPNFQNIPKRDKVAMNTVRTAIYPRKGHQLMELDYSGVEVGIAACYHKDPTMIKYITDPTTDMHGDMAAQIYMIDDFDRERPDHYKLRASAKNGFVFPQFYGDYFKMNAINICSNWVHLPQTKWKNGMGFQFDDGTFISDHLISKGLDSFDKFVEHIKGIELDFWKNRFPVYNNWKTTHYKQYLKNGFISLKTGFICKGVMAKNQVSNFPVQGAAFHCLLWCFTRLSIILEEKGMNTRLVGQIHDAVVLDVAPNELLNVYNLVQQIGTKDLVKAFKWINVPLSIDAELCPVDESWASKANWDPNK